MRFRLRTLVIAAGIGPPLLAGGWLAARAIAASGPGTFEGLLLAVPFWAVLLAPLWIPLGYLAYVVRAGELKFWPVVLFTLIEVWSCCVTNFIVEHFD
jgi:hypothetical protein